MKPTAFSPASLERIALKAICGMALAFAVALAPASAFAQRGAAAAHAGGARAGGVARAPQAPISRAPAAGVARPVTPIITRPATVRPAGVSPLVPHGPVVPFRAPLTSGFLFQPRPPRIPIRPIVPFLGTAGLFGLAYNPFLFPGCNPFLGFAYGCGIMAPYFGVGYNPAGIYPPGAGYPAPAYPPDPVYSPPDLSQSSAPTASLQYSPPLNPYPLAENLSPGDLGTSGNLPAQSRNEILLYLKDGSVFAVSTYTVSDGQLHYLTAYGEKNYFSVELLDLRKTIEGNAQRGVAFTLTPAAPPATPGASAPAPLGPAPAPEGPITPAKQ